MFLFFKDFLNFLGFLSASLYNVVPILFFCRLRTNKIDEKALSILGILFLYVNALYYSVLPLVNTKNLDALDFCNFIGFQVGLVYLIIYYKYLYYKTKKVKFFIFISIILASSIIVFLGQYFFIKNLKNTDWIEWIGVVFNVGEYLPLGYSLIHLITNKSSENLSLIGGSIGLINTIIWIIWAILTTINETKKKYHSLISNILGSLLCILQIILYFIFKKKEIGDEYTDVNPSNNNNIVIENENQTDDNIILGMEKDTSEGNLDFI